MAAKGVVLSMYRANFPENVALLTRTHSIVAVHGLASTAETTWSYKLREGQNVTIGPMWLRDFLPQENLQARIMVFNHNSAWERDATTKSLEDHGNDLLRVLDKARSTAEASDAPRTPHQPTDTGPDACSSHYFHRS